MRLHGTSDTTAAGRQATSPGRQCGGWWHWRDQHRSPGAPTATSRQRIAAVALVAASAALVLASCSSSTSSAAPAKTLTKTTNVTIALPIDLPPQSPVFLAQKLGYFQKNHLNVTIPIVLISN